MYVKICGLSTAVSARHAVRAGADAIGVVMSPRSPRHATPEQARAVLAAARAERAEIDTVLVVNRMAAAEAAALAHELGFDVLQLHGNYTAADIQAARALIPRVWRATSLADDAALTAGEYGEERLLVDARRTRFWKHLGPHPTGSGATRNELAARWRPLPRERCRRDHRGAAGRGRRIERGRVGPRGEGPGADHPLHCRGTPGVNHDQVTGETPAPARFPDRDFRKPREITARSRTTVTSVACVGDADPGAPNA